MDVFRGDTWEGKKTGLVIPWVGLLGEENAARARPQGTGKVKSSPTRPP